MLDVHTARGRAAQYALQTGQLSDMNLIHTMQRYDGFEACFGRALGVCPHSHCRWHRECMALMAFSPTEARGIAPKGAEGRTAAPPSVPRPSEPERFALRGLRGENSD